MKQVISVLSLIRYKFRQGGWLCPQTPPEGGQGGFIICIKDTGIGIPEAVKAKISQPFFTTKPTGLGTGLGLSLAYDIVVKGHGGALDVETKEGEGTEFVIQLPLKNNR